MDSQNNFFKTNLKNKIPLLQPEHINILKIIFKNACDTNIIIEFKFSEKLRQAMPISDILNNQTIDIDIAICCLSDLEHLGFIISSIYPDGSRFAISRLGLEYFKFIENK